MAALPGKNMAVKLATTAIGFTDTCSVSINYGSAETTAFGDTSKSSIPTIKDVSGSFSGTYDKADTGQDSVITEFLSGDGAVADLRIYVDNSHYYGGAAVVTGLTIGGGVADKVTYSVSFVGNGLWSYT